MTSTCIHIPIPPSPATPSEPSPLDARLGAALAFLRGGVMADVGTDHAYLPLTALTQGITDFAVATDIHKGPAEIAARHLSGGGIGNDRAVVLLTDGLHGAEQYHPTDICILGMGGEMIARIIDEAPWVKDSSVRLILQPMTKQETLREYLSQSGFRTVAELLVKTDRIYTVICAEYDGQARTLTTLERLVGKENLDRGAEAGAVSAGTAPPFCSSSFLTALRTPLMKARALGSSNFLASSTASLMAMGAGIFSAKTTS